MADMRANEPLNHEFYEAARPRQAQQGPMHLDLKDLHEVRMRITAHLGKCELLVRDVLELKRGSVVQLDKLAGEMTDIYLNGLPLAKGEVVVIGDSLHVRIGDTMGADEEQEEGERAPDEALG